MTSPHIRLLTLPLRLLGALSLSATVAFAAPLLRVGFVPGLANPLPPLSGFESFNIPLGVEQTLTPPISETFYGFAVTLSGRMPGVDKKITEAPGRLVSRVRSVPAAQQGYPYSHLLRCWVGNHEGFSLQIEGLKPTQKYKVTLYAYDFGSPEILRTGQNIVEDALNPNSKPITMAWDTSKDVLNESGPLSVKATDFVSTSSDEGRLLFSIRPGINTTGLINAFEIEEIR